MTIYFFGDSWCVGFPYPNYNTEPDTYASMVGKHFDLPVKNMGLHGSSQPGMIHQLLNSGIKSNDHAVFSMTANSRRFNYDTNGNPVDISDPIELAQLPLNDFDNTWMSAWVCYILYKYCLDNNITPWFINTFNVSYHPDYHHPLWDSIPGNNWIIPPDHMAVEHFDPVFFSRHTDIRNSDFNEWFKTQNNQVKYFMGDHGNDNHPGPQGRKKIAEIIINKLKGSII